MFIAVVCHNTARRVLLFVFGNNWFASEEYIVKEVVHFFEVSESRTTNWQENVIVLMSKLFLRIFSSF